MPNLRLTLAALLLAVFGLAGAVELNPSHPERYTVVRGDTLWDIAARFLRDPWRWPNVWQVNPQIDNPHLIYPGDVIVLTYVDGEPRLSLERGRDVKLSPRVRSTPLDAAIPTIPIDAIAQFLSRSYVMDKEAMEAAPYVVHFLDEHVMGGAGNQMYVRSLEAETPSKFEIIRPGKPYKDPDSGEILGYEARYIGNADLERTGDPAKLSITRSELEALIGDRLLPVSDGVATNNFFPRAPEDDITGRIISVMNGVSQIGQYNVVVLNKGAEDGLEPGHVLQIMQGGYAIRDTVSPRSDDTVVLPLEEAGVMMVFRTFSRVSFGLVMHATRPLHVLDWVQTPKG